MRLALDGLFDQALVFHCFTDYTRDYEIISHSVADPKTGISPFFDRYLFKYCVEASVTSTLTPETWRKSLDERLVDFATGKDLDGYVWGVKYQALYPGAQLADESPSAEEWERSVRIPFHEAVVETIFRRTAVGRSRDHSLHRDDVHRG